MTGPVTQEPGKGSRRPGPVVIVRVHHGAVGVLVAAVGIAQRSPMLVLAGLLLCWDDRKDAPWLR